MGRYTAPLSVEYDPIREVWTINKPFTFIRNNGGIIPVPVGFETDFASTGNIPFFPKDDWYNQACVVHDFLYAGEFVSRSFADSVFDEALKSIPQATKWQIPIMVFAVRLFGGLTYKQHTRSSINKVRVLSGTKDNEQSPLWRDNTLRFNKEKI